jgi:hypothetical protein
MSREIRAATPAQAEALQGALEHLRKAWPLLRAADCPKALERLESTIKSADGAERHMRHRLRRWQEESRLARERS